MKDERDDDTAGRVANQRHTLEDHMWGDLVAHDHGPDADHDHDEMFLDQPLEDNPIWVQDNVTLHSVGIDIGSSGTQVVFSRIHMRRHGEDLSSRFVVVARETLFESPVRLTPYSSESRIDDRLLGEIIDEAYHLAGISPDDVDTGSVILTGEALRRENAGGIAAILSQRGGDFVCATAGNHMESMLAAYGSGAVKVSSDEKSRILNIDIGGGTTKLAVIENGRIVSTAAIHIGGRLQVVDENNRITRLDPAGAYHARVAGFEWSVGDTVDSDALDQVAASMADALVASLTSSSLSDDVARLFLTDPVEIPGNIDGVMFSGGVGEYVYERETRDFGDLGKRLGGEIRRCITGNDLPWKLLPGHECIRATALGASEYSVQLSGNTCYISNRGKLLPRRNLQVIKVDVGFEEAVSAQVVEDAIREHMTAFDLDGSDVEFACAFEWTGDPEYSRIRAFAEGIRSALHRRTERGLSMYVMLDGDIASTLGRILKEELGVQSEILVIDGVVLRDFDYIDLGKVRLPSFTVPVTIKSLVFSEQPGVSRRKERIHHHGHAHG